MSALCALHLYWGFGGRWSQDKVVPTRDGLPVVKITAVSCLSAAWIFFLLAAVPVVSMKPGLRKWLLIGMAVIFFGRAIGEFRYLGFFKSVRGTPFAFWDTRLYSPLNLLAAALAGLSLL